MVSHVVADERLHPFPAYRDSGVEWLGNIPAHWALLPGRACFQEKLQPNTGLKESTVLSLSYGRIVVRHEDKLHGLVPASFETYQLVAPGDIICRPTDLQNDRTSLRFGQSPYQGIITSAYMCLKTAPQVDPRYGFSLLNAYDLKKVFYGLGSGLRQNLDWNDFKYLPCLVLPLAEQAAIVRYLDHADRRIQRAIRAKKRLIALLNEQKAAIIHRAVTQGLDPTVPMKPSGVEWLGNVPAHWHVLRLKGLFRERDTRTVSGTETLLSLRMYRGLVPHEEVSTISVSPEALHGFKIVEPGQLVMNRMRAAIGMFGIAGQRGLVSPDYAVFAPRESVVGQYYLSLFKTKAAGTIFRRESKGLGTGSSGFMRLYTDRFGVIKVPVPPVREQAEIVKYIADATAAIEQLGQTLNTQISLLQEFRTRLISDVVTGKLDVRAAAAGLPEIGAEDEPADEAEPVDEEWDGEDEAADEDLAG